MKRLILFILLSILLVVLTACGKLDVPQDDLASQRCLELGGAIEYVKALPSDSELEEDAVFGVCHLPDGVDCELWNLYKDMCEELNDRYYCTPQDREFEACLTEYNTACGYRSTGEILAEFSNQCEACREDQVAYVVAGECLEQI